MAFDATAAAVFFATTTPQTLTSDTSMVNEVMKQDYITSILARAQPMSRTLQGGAKIQDFILPRIGNSRQRYSPDGAVSYPKSNNIKRWEIPWSFVALSTQFDDHEIGLQTHGMSEGGAMAVFKRIRDIAWMDLWTQCLEGEEQDALAPPNTLTMEATPGGQPQEPFSLFAFNNEFTNGLFPSYTTGGAWTTVMGINPTTDTYWKPVVENYTHDVNALSLGEDFNLFQAFDRAMMKTKFKQAPLGKDYGEYQTRGSGICTTGSVGKSNFMIGLRRANNLLLGNRQDPAYPSPEYMGMEIMFVPGLDTALVYPNAGGTALVTQNDATVLGYPATGQGAPRYHGWQGEYLAPIWHSENYFKLKPQFRMNEAGRFWVVVQVVNSWKNLGCRSRRHQFTVAPNAQLS